MHSVIWFYFIILWFKLKCVRLTSALSVHSQEKGLFKCLLCCTDKALEKTLFLNHDVIPFPES